VSNLWRASARMYSLNGSRNVQYVAQVLEKSWWGVPHLNQLTHKSSQLFL
jgi:hypothetical protein